MSQKILAVKVTHEEWRAIQNQANDYTDGNLSEWMRRAALEYQPETLEHEDDDCTEEEYCEACAEEIRKDHEFEVRCAQWLCAVVV